MTVSARINPTMLSWARETSGLSSEEAANQLRLTATGKISAADKLREVESGARPVSHSLLQRMAALYRRPVIAFYLEAPPPRGERGEDFRMTAGEAVSPRDEAMLDALVRDVRARQQMVRDLLTEDTDREPLPFVASCRREDGLEAVIRSMRQTIAITVAEQRRANGAAGLFDLLRARAEQAGIFVLLIGDHGSYHSDLSDGVFRGFALADEHAPFVVINDNDAAAGRSFTLMHELAHVWIGASGVSGPLRASKTNAVERFCNTVASNFLLPAEAFSGLAADGTALQSLTDAIAGTWNVSQSAVTYRLWAQGSISDTVAGELFRAFRERWQTERSRAKERDAEQGGPTYYAIRRHRLGALLTGVVRRALQADALTHTRAARILGVAPATVDQLLRERPRAA